jgi:hypothetical protein
MQWPLQWQLGHKKDRKQKLAGQGLERRHLLLTKRHRELACHPLCMSSFLQGAPCACGYECRRAFPPLYHHSQWHWELEDPFGMCGWCVVESSIDENMLGCDFPILLVGAYCRNSAKAKIWIFPLGHRMYPSTIEISHPLSY